MSNLRGERGPQGIRGLRGPMGPPGITTFASDTSGRLFITTDDAGGAVAGNVVRLASAGVLAKAQADSAAHAAIVIGVYDGANVVPLHAQPIVIFDSQPVVGHPCYLSATLAGALTSKAPAIGAVSVPGDLIVLQDYTVGTAYLARVGKSASIVSPLGLAQQLIADAAFRFGSNPTALHWYFDDFDTLPATGFPNIGAIGYVISPVTHLKQTPDPSMLDFSTSDGSYPTWTVSLGTPCDPTAKNLLANAALSSQNWRMVTKIKTVNTTNTMKFWIDRGAAFETCGFGIGQSPAKFTWVCANMDWLLREATGTEYTVIGAPDTAWHVVDIYSIGDGNIHFCLDEGTETVVALPVSGSSAVPRWKLVADRSIIMDYWSIVTG